MLISLDIQSKANGGQRPRFLLPSKESIHNFKNKLLYMEGYKSLKMQQMYDALKDSSRQETLRTDTDMQERPLKLNKVSRSRI